MKKGEQWGENERSGILKGSKDLSCQRKQFDELWGKQNLVFQRNTGLKVQGEGLGNTNHVFFLTWGVWKKKKDTFGKVKTQMTSCLPSEKNLILYNLSTQLGNSQTEQSSVQVAMARSQQ